MRRSRGQLICQLLIWAALLAPSASVFGGVRYLVFSSGVDFDPPRIGQGGMMVGSGSYQYAWSRQIGLKQIHGMPWDTDVYVQDVNVLGTAIGSLYQQVGPNEYMLVAFTWTYERGSQVLADFGYPSSAYGINDLGDVVGMYDTGFGFKRGFHWKPDGTWVTLPPKYGGFCGGFKINNAGEILGYSQSGENSSTQVVWRPNGNIIDLGSYPGQSQTVAKDLNNLGYVCGRTSGTLGSIGFIWAPNGTYTGVFNPYFQGGFIDATGLNDSNVVVGTLSNGGLKGYVRSSSGTVTMINSLLHPMSTGWSITEAFDINNAGQISAVGYFNGQRRGLMLQPVKDKTPIQIGRGG